MLLDIYQHIKLKTSSSTLHRLKIFINLRRLLLPACIALTISDTFNKIIKKYLIYQTHEDN